MKVHVIGIYRMRGKAKKTGNDYDMCTLIGTRPVEIVANPTFQKTGFGLETFDIPVQADCMDKFAKLIFPCEIDLITDSAVRGGKMEAVGVDFHPIKTALNKVG